MRRNRKALYWTLLLAVLLCGCQRNHRGGSEVRGTVMVDGEPLIDGSVVFTPERRGHQAAAKVRDGKFHIVAADGPLPGACQVEVYPSANNARLDDPLALLQWDGATPVSSAPHPIAADPVQISNDSPNELSIHAATRNRQGQ